MRHISSYAINAILDEIEHDLPSFVPGNIGDQDLTVDEVNDIVQELTEISEYFMDKANEVSRLIGE